MLAAAISVLIAAPAQSGEDFESDVQKLGYSIGYQVGSDFHDAGVALDVEHLIEGMRRAIEGAEPRLSSDEMRESLRWLRALTDSAPGDDTQPPEIPGPKS
jgi:hypothetical protein